MSWCLSPVFFGVFLVVPLIVLVLECVVVFLFVDMPQYSTCARAVVLVLF